MSKQKRPNTVQPLGEIAVTPRNLKVLTARPQYEARVSVIYVFRIFFFFFFLAMALFLGVGDERSAGLVQVTGLIAVLI